MLHESFLKDKTGAAPALLDYNLHYLVTHLLILLYSTVCMTYFLWMFYLTCFHRAVDVGFGLIIHPVESGFHRQPGQSAVLALVSVRGGDVHGSALVVQRLLEVVSVLVPALCDPQLHPGPLVHH